jgi:hypothetical protein
VEPIIIINKEDKFTYYKSKLFKKGEHIQDLGKSSKEQDMSTELELFITKDKLINTLSQSPTIDTCGINTEQEFKSLEI